MDPKATIEKFVTEYQPIASKQTAGAASTAGAQTSRLDVAYLTELCTAIANLKDDSNAWRAKKTLTSLVAMDSKVKQNLSQVTTSPAKEIAQSISQGKNQQASQGFNKGQKPAASNKDSHSAPGFNKGQKPASGKDQHSPQGQGFDKGAQKPAGGKGEQPYSGNPGSRK